MIRTSRSLIACALVAAACLAVSGCGETESRGSGVAESKGLDLLVADCSESFRASSERLLPEMVEIALDSAAAERVLWAGCFAGAPLRTLAWDPKVDFGSFPAGAGASERLREAFNQARALGLESRLQRMIRETPATAPGSGQLEALEVAAEAEGVGRLFLFTDAAIHEPEVPDMTTATPAEIDQAIRLWAPRLSGLQGVHLILAGVGYGVHNSASVRSAKLLFRGLAKRIGAASFRWTPELPVEIPSGES